jgi:hypothetical protein
MAIYLKCEACLQLWKEYGLAVAAIRSSRNRSDDALVQIAAIEQALLTHQAVAHPKAGTRS